MKLRHAAALAILGWFLMVPQILASQVPTDKDLIGPFTTNNKPDFTSWRRVGIFNTEAACEAARSELQTTLVYKSPVPKETIARVAAYSQCVASNDPRVKLN